MNIFNKKILYYGFYGAFLLVFGWVSGQLFFEKQMDEALSSIREFLTADVQQISELDELTVIYPYGASSLNPFDTSPFVRQWTANIYESLVTYDRDMKIKPALAVSWGLVDENVWEFRLRPGVRFHDGSLLDMQDILKSFEIAMNGKDSQLVGILENIENIEIVNDEIFRIKTKKPDPLLLPKLSLMYVVPSEIQDNYAGADFIPVGTGSYKFSDFESGSYFVVQRFSEYFGQNPKFDYVKMVVISDKSKRVNAFLNGEADFLSFVSFDAADAVMDRGFTVTSIPSLEVQFLAFNLESEVFNDVLSRRAFSLAVDQKALVSSIGKYAKPVSQFVSSGVFGFNPEINPHEYNLKEAQEVAEKSGLKGKTVQFHLTKGLNVLGEHVRKQLKEIGVYVVVSYLETAEFLKSFEKGSADLYFAGYKSDLGDSADFLNTFIKTDGQYNVWNYKNSEVDELVNTSLTEMDPKKRLKALHEAMKIAIEEDVIGIPLFEYDTLYSFVDKISMQPRIDGLIYFDELNVR
ncbi:MAG: ABC transporter substrate-binding protein [Patescibacteria group bacterium]